MFLPQLGDSSIGILWRQPRFSSISSLNDQGFPPESFHMIGYHQHLDPHGKNRLRITDAHLKHGDMEHHMNKS